MRRSTDSLVASVIVAIITIPKKKTSSPYVKEKRKAGTRAGLTKAAIVAAAAKLIESVGANGFSLRRLAKALGVGPTTIHFHSKAALGTPGAHLCAWGRAGRK
jgi:Bacterial regulatory proteins, tetR family